MAGSPAGTLDPCAIPELQSWLLEQDRKWLDTGIPALEGQTPRQAAAIAGSARGCAHC